MQSNSRQEIKIGQDGRFYLLRWEETDSAGGEGQANTGGSAQGQARPTSIQQLSPAQVAEIALMQASPQGVRTQVSPPVAAAMQLAMQFGSPQGGQPVASAAASSMPQQAPRIQPGQAPPQHHGVQQESSLLSSLLSSPEFVSSISELLNAGVPFPDVVRIVTTRLITARSQFVATLSGIPTQGSFRMQQAQSIHAAAAALPFRALLDGAETAPGGDQSSQQDNAEESNAAAAIDPLQFLESLQADAQSLERIQSQDGVAQSSQEDEEKSASQPQPARAASAASHQPRQDNARRLLYMPMDNDYLSKYQCLARRQIELFEASYFDIDASAQGRNKPIQVGQVGVRCIHCSHLHPNQRQTGSQYFPSQLTGVYQTARKLTAVHLTEKCNLIPPEIRQQLIELKEDKTASVGGRKYWSDGAKVRGVEEVPGGGLRFARGSSDGTS